MYANAEATQNARKEKKKFEFLKKKVQIRPLLFSLFVEFGRSLLGAPYIHSICYVMLPANVPTAGISGHDLPRNVVDVINRLEQIKLPICILVTSKAQASIVNATCLRWESPSSVVFVPFVLYSCTRVDSPIMYVLTMLFSTFLRWLEYFFSCPSRESGFVSVCSHPHVSGKFSIPLGCLVQIWQTN
jgi:hypothetical protein